MATFYIDTDSFETALSAYSDPGLTTKASDGYYSDGVIYRQQVSGVLYPPVSCPSCPVSCGTLVSVSTGDIGVYEISFDAGSGTGVVEVSFDPNSVTKGIRVEFDSVLYVTAITPDGPGGEGNKVFVGNSANDCGVEGSSFVLNVFKYANGAFVDTQEPRDVTAFPRNMHLSASDPGPVKILVPKPSSSPSEVKITVYVPCLDDTDFDIKVECPVSMTGFDADPSPQSNDGAACALGGSYGDTFYNFPIAGVAGVPSVGDIIYLDANGETLAGEGYYNFSLSGNSSAMYVNSLGEVETITACASTVFVSSSTEGEGIQSTIVSVTSIP